MKQEVLTLLRSRNKEISGNDISRSLSISRTAVWKNIQSLKDEGFKISSSRKGYLLSEEADCIAAWNLPDIPHYSYRAVSSSTMHDARSAAEEGAPHLSFFAAGRQTAGSGRLDRQWISPEGGLYVTVLLRPLIELAAAWTYPLAAACALSEALRELYAIEAGVKWPNDVLIEDKKAAGILTETKSQANRVLWISIGIGLNVNNPAPLPDTISICDYLKRRVERKPVLIAFRENLIRSLDSEDQQALIRRWQRYSATIGSSVEVDTGTEIIRGTAVDIGGNGALRVRTGEGLRDIFYGDCIHAGRGPS
jgi:BirA family biotin operon repressor/biotin-[acetyl-CoA-carboxylase] ligase